MSLSLSVFLVNGSGYQYDKYSFELIKSYCDCVSADLSCCESVHHNLFTVCILYLELLLLYGHACEINCFASDTVFTILVLIS
jgi:hypothetical protein